MAVTKVAMLKNLALSLAALALLQVSASADTGIFNSFVVIDTGSGANFYDLGSTTALPDFASLNGSVFDPSVPGHFTFTLTGGELQTFKNGNSNGNGFNNIGTPTLFFAITSGGPAGSFSVPFNSEFGGSPSFGSNPGDQKWQVLGQNVNLLQGLAPGNYTATIHISAPTGNGNLNNTLDTGNFSVSFTVVPEPSSLALLAGPGLLAAWFFARRRRA